MRFAREDEEPLVSICIITYNHIKYITAAIDSVLMQQTDFSCEVIIADDCSTDGTIEILKDYKKKFGNSIRLILQPKNVGPSQNWLDLISAPKGKYISYFEGDDYWTDSNKLQKQIDFLEANPAFSICTHNVLVSMEEDDGNILQQTEWLGKDHRQVSTIKDLLMYGSGGATCSLVFLAKCITNPDELFEKIPSSDIALQIICAQYGNLYYMKEVMGVYRRHPVGVTTLYSQIKIFNELGVQRSKKINTFLNGKYHYEINFLLYNYYYPNLIKAYKEAGKYWHCNFWKLKKTLLQLKYRFQPEQHSSN